MNDIYTSRGFQTERDNNYKPDIETDKYANVSTVKPLQFLNHVHSRVFIVTIHGTSNIGTLTL